MCGGTSEASVLFHWFISLFWYQYHLITVALWYSFKSGSVMPPALFFCLGLSWLCGLFFGSISSLRWFFPTSVKKINGSLMEIALILYFGQYGNFHDTDSSLS